MRNKILLLAAFISFLISNTKAQNYQFSALGNTTVTNTCKGTFTASGDYQGTGTYGNNVNKTVTFCSGTPGVPIRISFITWSLEAGFDFLRIYDGTGTGGTLLGTINGTSDIFTSGALFFTSTGTCLTVQLVSDGTVTGYWDAIIGCQPQNCGSNLPASDACGAAPQICDLNGYCGNTSGWYTRDNGQIDNAVGNGQFCGSIENNSWLTFVASATTATLNVTSSNCAVTTTGIQARVYATNNCATFTPLSNCVSQGGTGNGGPSGTFTLTANSLTIGTRYYVMIDGFAGNICDYTVTANTGVQVLSFSSTASANQICEGGTASISINGAISGSTYSWTASPPGSITGPTDGATINVNPTVTTVYSVVVTQPNGCLTQTESFTLTVNPKKTTTLTQTVCAGQSVTVCGQTYNSTGTFTKVCTTSKGCDSTVTLNLTVRPAITSTVTQTVCVGQSITVCGQTYNQTGTFTKVCQATNGCDSTVTINLTVRPAITSTITQSVCAGQSITVCGQTYSQTGTFTKVCQATNGCDSTVTINLTVRPAITSTITQSVCAGQSITVCGQTYSQTGTFTKVCTATNGCDSTVTINLTVNPVKTTNISDQLCNGQSIIFNGQIITMGGTYRDTLSTSAGCDSFIVLTVTLVPFKTTPISRSICNGQSTTFNGQTITQAGIYRDTLSTSLGCDSFVVLTVILNPTPTTPISRSICQGQSTTFNGQTITQAGTFRDTLSTSAGCDSFIVLTVTLNPTQTTPISRSICQGQSTTFNGQTITQAGTYRDTLTTSLGCDSFIVLTVTLNPTPTTPISRSICQGQSTTFNGQTITQAGTFRDTLSTSAGCDSFIVLTVTLNPTPTSPISRSICQGQSTTFNGQTITQAGIYRDTLSTSLGCDSFIVLSVTINPVKTTPLSQQICQGSSIVFNGQTITQAGTYRDTFSTTLGCDSFIVLTVTVNNVLTTNQTQTICQGQSIVFNGQTISQSGVYRDTFRTVQGCDSFIVLTVNVNPSPITNINRVICQGDSVTIGNQTFNSTGVFTVVLQSSLSCDSTVILDLTVNPVSRSNISEIICDGDSITIGNQTFTASGRFTIVLQNSNDCDSVVILDLVVNPAATTNITKTICQGEAEIIGNQVFTATGNYTVVLQTSASCDSTVNLNLTVLDSIVTNLSFRVCNGEAISVGDSVYTESGDYVNILGAASGCDSIVYLSLIVDPAINEAIRNTICEGDSVTIGNQTFKITGAYSVVLVSAAGCDSIVNLDLTVNSITRTSISRSICSGENVTVGNEIFNETGEYTVTLQSTQGCDSIVLLDLIVNSLPSIDAVSDQPTVNINEPVQLNVITTENLTYNWTPADLVSNANIQNPTAVLTQSTWFYVTATSTNGQTQCRFTDSVFVELNELACSRKNVFIPNAFTPNGDEANDIFIPRSSILKSMKLVVYNRLGNQVFESNDINTGWDGNYKGQPAPEDAYGYYFIGECSQGEKITINGNVTLLR